MNKGKALIFSAPSGSGKTTIVKHLLNNRNDLEFSISATTRTPRNSEKDGRDYYFLQKDIFEKKIQNDEFVEWEEVYGGVYYGTLKSELQRIWDNNHHVIFDVDVEGGCSLKKYLTSKALSIFVKTKDIETLIERLSNRGTDSGKNLEERIKKAEKELKYEEKFDVSLLNDKIDQTLILADQLVSEFLNSKI